VSDVILSKAERSRLAESITAGAKAVHFSNATIGWFLDSATPGQMQAVDGMLKHEAEVRRRNKHARLLRRAKFPAVKSVEDFDSSDLRFPDGYGWDDMLSLEWIGEHQDFVFHGPTGRG
jgi:DNA replication protein DnaC